MNPYSHALIFVGIMLFIVGINTVFYNTKILRSFSILCLLSAIWQFSWAILLNVDSPSYANVIAKIGHVPIILVFPANLYFTTTFLQFNRLATLTKALAWIAIPLILLLPTNLIISGAQKHFFGFYPTAGPLHFLLLIYSTCTILGIYYCIYSSFRTMKKNKEYVLFSTASFFYIFAATDFLVNYGYSFFPVGFAFVGTFALFSLVAVITGLKTEILNMNNSLETMVNEAVTKLQVQQQQTLQSQKMATIGLIASGVAHQLGNTLNVISGNTIAIAGLAQKKPANIERILHRAQSNLESIDLSKFIISSLNSASKENEERQDNNLREIVEASFVLVKGKALERVALINQIDGALTLPCIRGSIIQIFMNFISNSIDAITGSEGEVIISASDDEDNVHIAIKDNGHGIPNEIQENIFAPFVTSKPGDKGTGLGLYVVKAEIEKSGGSISFVTGTNGTSFNITLPKDLRG